MLTTVAVLVHEGAKEYSTCINSLKFHIIKHCAFDKCESNGLNLETRGRSGYNCRD